MAKIIFNNKFQRDQLYLEIGKKLADMYNIYKYDLSENEHRKLCVCLAQVIHLQEVAIQNIMGYFKEMKDGISLFEIVCMHPWIRKQVFGKRIIAQATVKLSDLTWREIDNLKYPLPSEEPIYVDKNTDMGIAGIRKHVLLGNAINEHDMDVNLSHLRTKNSIKLRLQGEMFKYIDPIFDATSKVRKNGKFETPEEVVERYYTFHALMKCIRVQLKRMDLHKGFYLPHGYCSRGRTYVCAYEFNYQGITAQKAVIQFDKSEIVKDEF